MNIFRHTLFGIESFSDGFFASVAFPQSLAEGNGENDVDGADNANTNGCHPRRVHSPPHCSQQTICQIGVNSKPKNWDVNLFHIHETANKMVSLNNWHVKWQYGMPSDMNEVYSYLIPSIGLTIMLIWKRALTANGTDIRWRDSNETIIEWSLWIIVHPILRWKRTEAGIHTGLRSMRNSCLSWSGLREPVANLLM